MVTIAGRKLRDASFRGVPFFVSESSVMAGRRVVVHEYPQRDKPYVEDLGRATRKITEKCFVCGDDYIEQTQTLLAALERPGSGTLIHPWLGKMSVTPTDISSISYVNGKECYATFTLTFVESGELSFPSARSDTASLVKDAADKLQAGAIESFLKKIDLEPFTTYINAAMSGDLLEVLGVIESSELAAVFDFSDRVANLISSGLALLSSDPRVFATQLANAMGLSRLSTSVARWSAVGSQVSNLFKKDDLKRGTSLCVAYDRGEIETVWSDSLVQRNQNRAALETLCRQILVAQSVGAVSLMATDLNRPFESDAAVPAAFDEIESACEVLMGVIDDEILIETDDDVYDSLCDARIAVFEHLTELANSLSRLTDIRLNEVQPALVVAYDYFGETTREAEIVARNKVANGGFCPVNLRILTQ